MGMPTSESFLVARSGEPRTRTALLLESITLRHQIALLERSELVARAFAFGIGCFGSCVWRIADSGEISNSPHTGMRSRPGTLPATAAARAAAPLAPASSTTRRATGAGVGGLC